MFIDDVGDEDISTEKIPQMASVMVASTKVRSSVCFIGVVLLIYVVMIMW